MKDVEVGLFNVSIPKDNIPNMKTTNDNIIIFQFII